MSEEKPTFKITDRRLFNPDGTPREVIREEEPPAATTPAPEPPASAAATPEPPAAPRGPETPEAAAASAGAGREPAREREVSAEAGAEAAGDEGFLMLVEFLASFAADALGMVNHPGGGGVNLPLAKQCIDMLGTLKQKTRGNLAGEEQQFLDMILSQL
ncbi:MAG TPA: DUF1844 domain-containing protein, partial [Pyrinomonadaceae bacterium]|nr:DUF1844 domain-containing protein [Pyrinomonadaceae bacterium]